MPKQTMRDRLLAYTSPCVTVKQNGCNFFPVSDKDTQALLDMGIIPPFHVMRYDEVLDKVNDAGYWLESVLEEESEGV